MGAKASFNCTLVVNGLGWYLVFMTEVEIYFGRAGDAGKARGSGLTLGYVSTFAFAPCEAVTGNAEHCG